MRRTQLPLLLSILALVTACDSAAPEDAATPGPDAAADASVDGNFAPPVWTPPSQCEGVTSTIGGEPGGAGVRVSGNAFSFTLAGGRIEGAYVTANEHPTWCARTGADGDFELDGVEVGSDLTLRLHHEDFPLLQTGTHTVPPEGMERLTFQAPDHDTYRLMAQVARVRPDASLCQIAATVTEVGRSLYTTDWPSHGEAGATVTLAPDPGDAVGPIYFEYLGDGTILPNRDLTETTRDGGILFLNVPPGDYVLSASKPSVTFTDVRIHCEAGLLVNPSPPWSLQALAP